MINRTDTQLVHQSKRTSPFGDATSCWLLLLPLALLTFLPLHEAYGQEAAPAATEAPADEPDPVFGVDDLQTPSLDDLLNLSARDWVILNNDDVFIVDSIVPRPDTLAIRNRQIERKEDERRQAQGADRERIALDLDNLNYVYVSLPNVKGNPERRIRINLIREIVHHEDLMLRRLNILLDEKEIDSALELLVRLEKSWERWPGLSGAHNRILFVEAELRLSENRNERALALLRELQARDKGYPLLSQRYGEAIDRLVAAALETQDYSRAIFYLDDLANRFSNHPVFQKYDAQLSALVHDLIAKAKAAAQQGDHRQAVLLVEEAAGIWPRTSELAAAYRQHANRYQRLHVGTVEPPMQGKAFFLPTIADRRVAPLTRLPLFELNRMRDGTAYYDTRFFDEWEPLDLGRRMQFTLRSFRQPSDVHNVITAPDVVTPLLRRLDPHHAEYDERLASYVDSIDVQSPLQFTIHFRRVPPRVEPLLAGVMLQVNESDELGEDGISDPTLIGPLTNPGGFTSIDVPANRFALTRTLPQPDGLPQYHVAELVERQYENHEQAIQGLMRGEVSMLVDLPDWLIRRMQDDEGFRQQFNVQKLSLPATQVIQFNPQSKPLRVRELRRALAYAVDRDRLLREFVLQDDDRKHARVVTGPFPANSPARHVLVQERRYDLSSAIAMSVAARNILKSDLPTLRMIVEPGAVQEAAATEIVRVWNRIGIPVELIKGTDAPPENWDMIYRSVEMVEPLVQMWPFLTITERAQLSDLDHYPDWLKQELVEVDRTSDQSRAMSRMQELHRHLWLDAAFIPLWEIDRYRVVRKSVIGFPPRAMHNYDGIGQWISQPWYAGGE